MPQLRIPTRQGRSTPRQMLAHVPPQTTTTPTTMTLPKPTTIAFAWTIAIAIWLILPTLLAPATTAPPCANNGPVFHHASCPGPYYPLPPHPPMEAR